MRSLLFFAFVITTVARAGEFSTSIGDIYPYLVSAIATDPAGNSYIVGSRVLSDDDVPLSPPAPNGNSPLTAGSDVFVTKLDPTGKTLFTDTFAGKGLDEGTAVAVDPTGNIYIAGTTTSDDFPLSNALQTQPDGSFIIKLSSDGKTILYSTYFGGTLGPTSISGLTTDAGGNLYVTGTTSASDFPHTPGLPFAIPPRNSIFGGLIVYGGFVTSISPAGDKIRYSGVISGTKPAFCFPGSIFGNCETTTHSAGIALDSAGNAYITGLTDASDLPVTPGTSSAVSSGGQFRSAFVAKITPGGTVGYLTYFPTNVGDVAAIVVDTVGSAYIGGIGSTSNAGSTGSLWKFKPDGSAIVWQTTVGDQVQSIAVDSGGNTWAVGSIRTNPVPNNNGWTTGQDFLVRWNASGSSLTYSALFPAGTAGQSVALDNPGFIHVAGANGVVSAIAPATAPVMKIFGLRNAAGGSITSRISPAEVISILGPGIGPATAATAVPANGFFPTLLAGVQVTINGIKAPLLYASANQIDAVVPMALTSFSGANVQVINGTTASQEYPAQIVIRSPQAFPGVLNQDGTLNSQINPARSGSVVTFYGTGWQWDFSPLADGQVATGAKDFCRGSCRAGVSLANLPVPSPQATVLYGGFAPDIVAGVSQFNVNVGPQTDIQAFPVTFTVSNDGFNAAASQPLVTAQVWVAP